MSVNQQVPSPLVCNNMDTLIDNIPGGMFSCLFDAQLTLLQVNLGFLSMLGYTRADISALFHDSFWGMIDPRDREGALAEALRQTALGPNKELEYRMKCKDGTVIWVLDKGRLIQDEQGRDAFCCVLVDITRSKELEYALRMSLERHQIISDQATDIIFEWDILADTFDFSLNWEKKFGYHPLTKNVSRNLPTSPHIVREDRALLIALLERIRGGMRYGEVELRLKKNTTTNIWCRMRLTGQQDQSFRTVKAVGVIIDIDAEKCKAQRLLESAQRDTLTKLYNKGVTQDLVTDLLVKSPLSVHSALFIIDLDYFKNINDTLGHLSGDALLIEAAQTIQLQFRDGDIVGRVGGDEFLAFLFNIPDRATAESKAAKIVASFSAMTVHELPSGSISCSVGVALFPDCGVTFHALFQRADQALYQAKHRGRRCYSIFDPASMDLATTLPGQQVSAVSARIDSNEGIKSVSGQLVEYIFHILYKSANVESAVSSILEIVGLHFDVSRAYIFENTADDLHCCNTFEWCNVGVLPEIEHLRHVSFESDLGGNYLDNFNEDGVFYCRDIRALSPLQYQILAPQGIKSLLQCAICNNGQFKGYVGFDECRMNRCWTQEQVDALTFISEVLGIFLLKQRAQDHAIQSATSMEAALDSQSAWIYAIRPETYELLYLNRKTSELVPTAQIGMRCHEVFFSCSAPCPFCPAQKLSQNQPFCNLEVYNPLLQVWSSTEASHFMWRNEKAVLLTCHDITTLKNALSGTQ